MVMVFRKSFLFLCRRFIEARQQIRPSYPVRVGPEQILVDEYALPIFFRLGPEKGGFLVVMPPQFLSDQPSDRTR